MGIRSSFIYKSKRLWAAMAATLSIVLLVAAPAVSADTISIGGASDCDSNAILQCGAHTTTGLIQKYQGDPYAMKVYAAFGLKQLDITTLPANNVAGRVTRSGEVYIDSQSKPVATNAITAGRQNIAGSTAVSTAGITFYKRPPSVSFQQASLPAFVSMVNGRFQFAVIASCGNPVIGSAIYTPPAPTGVGQGHPVSKPKPQPQPKQRQDQTQSQSQSQTQTQTQSQDQTQTQTQSQSQDQSQEQVSEQAAPAAPAAAPAPATAAVSTTSSLPDTGPAGLAGLFTVSSIGGTLVYRRYLRSRLQN